MSAAWRLELHTAADVPASVLDCERDVLFHWYGNTSADIDEAYGPYLDQTLFLSLRSLTDDLVIAFARLLLPGSQGLKTLNDLAGPPWQVTPHRALHAAGIVETATWDIATLGARPGRVPGRHLASMAVYHSILASMRANEVRTLIAVVDTRVRRLLSAAGLACHTLPGAFPSTYLGSADSVPVYAHIAATIDEQRRVHPDAHRLVTLAQGLTDVELPSTDDYRSAAALVPDRLPRVITLPSSDPSPAEAEEAAK